MNNLLEITIKNLVITYSSAIKEERELAEKELKEISSDLSNFSSMVISSFKQNLITSTKIQNSLSIYLKNLIRDKTDKKKLKIEDALNLLKGYSEVIFEIELENSVLLNFTNTLQYLLNYNMILEKQDIIVGLITFFENMVMNLNNERLIKNVITFLENILLSSSITKENALVNVTKIFEMINKMLVFVLDKLKSNSNSIEFYQSSHFLLYNDLICIIYNFLYISIIKLKSRLDIIDNFASIYRLYFIPAAIQIIMSKLPIQPDFFIIWTGNQDFDSSLNLCKMKCFNFLNNIMTGFKNNIADEAQLNHIYFVLLEESIKNLAYIVENKLEYIRSMDKESSASPDNNYEGLIIQILEFLNRILMKDNYYLLFNNDSKKFFSDIIFPLLITTKKEFMLMKDDGQFYQVFSSDLIEAKKNLNKIIKVQVAILLRNLLMKYDGLGHFVIQFCLEILDFFLNDHDPKIKLKYFDFHTNSTLRKLNIEDNIDIALLILGIIENFIKHFPSQSAPIKTFLDKHLEKLVNIKPIVPRTRLCMFLNNYMKNFYDKKPKEFSICSGFLISNITSYSENQGIATEAISAISNIFDGNSFDKIISDKLQKILGFIIELVSTIDIPIFFDLLMDIVVKVDVDDYVLDLASALTKRILKDIKKKFNVIKKTVISEKEKGTFSYINKCFNVIRAITESPSIIMKNIVNSLIIKDKLEAIFEPLFIFIQNPDNFNIDEDLIYICTNFLKYTQKVTKSTKLILPYLIDYLSRNNGMTSDLFELLSLYIINGDEFISQDINYMSKYFIDIFKFSLDENLLHETSFILGSLLIQIFLQKYNKIPIKWITDIVQYSMFLLSSITVNLPSFTETKKFSSLHKINAVISIIFSAVLNYPILTMEIISSNNEIINFILWNDITLKSKFSYSYIIKVIILALCNVLSNKDITSGLNSSLNEKIINYIYLFLNKQKLLETDILNSKTKNEIECNFVDDETSDLKSNNNSNIFSDSEDDDNESSFKIKINMEKLNKKVKEELLEEQLSENINLENEIKTIYKDFIIKSPFSSTDEYEIAKISMDKFFANHPDILNNWHSSLSEQDKCNLENLVHTRRVNLHHGEMQSVPRKILKIKRYLD